MVHPIGQMNMFGKSMQTRYPLTVSHLLLTHSYSQLSLMCITFWAFELNTFFFILNANSCYLVVVCVFLIFFRSFGNFLPMHILFLLVVVAVHRSNLLLLFRFIFQIRCMKHKSLPHDNIVCVFEHSINISWMGKLSFECIHTHAEKWQKQQSKNTRSKEK